MAFDIYSGTFLRFYTRDWENVVQKQAREQGTEYRIIYAKGNEDPPAAAEVAEAVAAWQQGMNSALSPHGLGPIEWSESDELPYFTDRPSWEGYLAVQMWAAHLERPEAPVPQFLPEQSSVLAEVLGCGDDLHFRSILQGGVWLPGDFEFTFKFPTLVEEKAMIGSTGRLLRELRELRQRPLQWARKPWNLFARKKDAVVFRDIADWALTVFENVVERGHAAKLPFILSF